MFNVLVATRFAWTIASIFGVSGMLHFAGLEPIRRGYARWNFAPGFYRVAGALQLLAAFFLALPITRLWGVMLAGFLTFAAVIILLNNRQYVYSVPGLILLVALVPAALAGPV